LKKKLFTLITVLVILFSLVGCEAIFGAILSALAELAVAQHVVDVAETIAKEANGDWVPSTWEFDITNAFDPAACAGSIDATADVNYSGSVDYSGSYADDGSTITMDLTLSFYELDRDWETTLTSGDVTASISWEDQYNYTITVTSVDLVTNGAVNLTTAGASGLNITKISNGAGNTSLTGTVNGESVSLKTGTYAD
jgi:hypothetical protein